jgi:hypothetical protein
MDDWGIDVGVPDVGDRVEYRGNRYAVTGWMRERPKRKNLDERLDDNAEWSVLMDDLLYESQQNVHGKKLENCYRDEAQFVTLRGVGGTVAPIDQVKVIGKVQWSPEILEEQRQSANRRAEERQILF